MMWSSLLTPNAGNDPTSLAIHQQQCHLINDSSFTKALIIYSLCFYRIEKRLIRNLANKMREEIAVKMSGANSFK